MYESKYGRAHVIQVFKIEKAFVHVNAAYSSWSYYITSLTPSRVHSKNKMQNVFLLRHFL